MSLPLEIHSRYREGGPDGYTRSRFRSWYEFVEHCKAEPIGPHRSSREHDSDHGCYICQPDSFRYGNPTTNDWHGSATFKEAIEQASGKADNGVELMKKYSSALSSRVGEKILQPVYVPTIDPGDSDIDMGAYCEGNPEMYMEPRRQYADAPSQTTALIYFHFVISCGVPHESIAKRGAVALALAELLELGGISTRIVIAGGLDSSSFQARHVHDMEIIAKDYSQPFDLPMFAFAFSNPGMHRRLTFSHNEQLPVDIQRDLGVGHGYGIPRNVRDVPESAIVFHHGRINDEWLNPETAADWCETVLKEKGVNIAR